MEMDSPGDRETAGERLQLKISTPGVLDGLEYETLPRLAPAGGEVEISVEAAGLNFRDVLNALGMYPGDAGPLGWECAGTVAAVGEGVDDLKIGDAVVAIAPGAFSNFVTTHAALAVPKPDNLTFAEAATIPSAFLTAFYTLVHLAHLSAGEKVLIHSAAGGVGLAAVQVAQRAGAEIFATAGSPEKREFLKRLGVQHVFDSRSLEFAERISELTNRKGIDVVLNSLSGRFYSQEPFAPERRRPISGDRQERHLGRRARRSLQEYRRLSCRGPGRDGPRQPGTCRLDAARDHAGDERRRHQAAAAARLFRRRSGERVSPHAAVKARRQDRHGAGKTLRSKRRGTKRFGNSSQTAQSAATPAI